MAATDYGPYRDSTDEEAPFVPGPRATPPRIRKSCFPQARSSRSIIILLYCILFILAFGGHLIGVPALRIFEDIICHHYYEDGKSEGYKRLGDIDEEMCKGEEIQNQLNILLAGSHFLGAIPGMITTIPYGLLADRIGRKPVFLFSICGMLISGVFSMLVMYFWRALPLRLIWLSPVFMLIGGGEAVTGMSFYAIGSDVTTDANRANAFLYGACAVFLAELIAPTVTSIIMLRSPWASYITGMCVLALGMVSASFISETLHTKNTSESEAQDPSTESGLNTASSESVADYFTSLKSLVRDGLKRVYESTSVLHSPPAILLFIPFITSPFGRQAMDLSIRYISKRFQWRLSQTNFLLTLRALVNIILFAGIIPGLSHILMERLHYSSKEKDLALARLSVSLLVLGSLFIAFGSTIDFTILGIIIITLGTGFITLVRSLITTLVDKEHVGRLYAAVAVVETFTSLIASPTLATLYAIGLKWKGPWLGLPFFGAAVIFFLGGLGVWCFSCLKIPQEEMPYGDDEDRDSLLGNTLVLDGGID